MDKKINTNDFDAVIFDLDGVVTRTAKAHEAAWKKLFDDYLEEIGNRDGIRCRPFSNEDPGCDEGSCSSRQRKRKTRCQACRSDRGRTPTLDCHRRLSSFRETRFHTWL